MKIIKATKTDLESLESLCENCFPSEATTQINFTNTDDTYLLYKNSSLIGSISFQKYHLYLLQIHPKYQRKGLGAMLLNFSLQNMTKNNIITTSAIYDKKSGLNSVPFFVRNGFKTYKYFKSKPELKYFTNKHFKRIFKINDEGYCFELQKKERYSIPLYKTNW